MGTWQEAYKNTRDAGLRALVDKLTVDDQLRKHATQPVVDLQARVAKLDFSDPQMPGLLKALDALLKLKTAHERAFHRSLREVEQYQGRRKNEEFVERRLAVFEVKEAVALALLCKKNGLDAAAFKEILNRDDDAEDEPNLEPSRSDAEGGTDPHPTLKDR